MISRTTRTRRSSLGPLLLVAALAPAASLATEMVYYPINPSFGGNPLNGPHLLNMAQAQNKHRDPDADLDRFGIQDRSPLDSFNDTLERAVLNRLATAATSQITGLDGTLQPGTVRTDNFTIDIVDIGGGALQITTTDILLGTSTSFVVGR